MQVLSKLLLFWTPRAICIAFAIVQGLFAFDVITVRHNFWSVFAGISDASYPRLLRPGLDDDCLAVGVGRGRIIRELGNLVYKRTLGAPCRLGEGYRRATACYRCSLPGQLV